MNPFFGKPYSPIPTGSGVLEWPDLPRPGSKHRSDSREFVLKGPCHLMGVSFWLLSFAEDLTVRRSFLGERVRIWYCGSSLADGRQVPPVTHTTRTFLPVYATRCVSRVFPFILLSALFFSGSSGRPMDSCGLVFIRGLVLL